MNRIIIKGRLTASPELKTTKNGKVVTTVTVAVDRPVKGIEGKETDFFNCVFWESAATFVCNYFTKGQEILLEGSMQSRRYTDKDGNERTAWEIQFAHAEFCGSKAQREERPVPDNVGGVPVTEASETSDDYPF